MTANSKNALITISKNIFKSNLILIIFLGAFAISGCKNECQVCELEDDSQTEFVPETNFALGADISWITELKSNGVKFFNSKGEEKECTKLMSELGLNAIRLRVWVNPSDGWCNKDDVLVKALRAKKLGLKVMIDFHYSDRWADPGHQVTPETWKKMSYTYMKKALYNHTVDVLELLKKNNVSVSWVQVGNETANGMLHPIGDSYKEIRNYAGFISSGYDAVKSVFPEAIVIVHVENGDDLGKVKYHFDRLIQNNGKFDMIGLSLYPYWSKKDWQEAIDDCIGVMRWIKNKYRKDVMICETGMPVDDSETAYLMLSTLLKPKS